MFTRRRLLNALTLFALALALRPARAGAGAEWCEVDPVNVRLASGRHIQVAIIVPIANKHDRKDAVIRPHATRDELLITGPPQCAWGYRWREPKTKATGQSDLASPFAPAQFVTVGV